MELSASQSMHSDIDVEMITSMNGNGRKDLAIQQLSPSDFKPESLIRIYRDMLVSRRLDEKMITLLKQGKGYFHIGCSGHEAAQAAIAYFSRQDMTGSCPTIAIYVRLYLLACPPKVCCLPTWRRLMTPIQAAARWQNISPARNSTSSPTSSSVGAQYLPALGAAMAMQRSDKDGYVYVSSGDGATSQGDFHEALNWAVRIKALFYSSSRITNTLYRSR